MDEQLHIGMQGVNLVNFKNKGIKILTLFLVACQSILFTLLAAFFIGENYNHVITNYPNVKKTTFYLHDTKTTAQTNVLSFLTQESTKRKLLIVRTDQTLSGDGNAQGIKLGVMGDVDQHPIPLNFAGNKVITPSLLKKLLQSKTMKTIGNALNYESITDTPNFAGGQKLTVFKLSDLIAESGSINGNYQVIGLNVKQKSVFLNNLAKVSQTSKAQLEKSLSGGQVEQSLMPVILIIGISINALGLLILFLLNLLQELSKLGDLVLLGWSKINFMVRLYLPYIIMALIMTVISVPLGIILSGKYLSLWSVFFTINLISIGLVSLLSLLASTLIMTLSFTDILKHKFPRKTLLTFSVLGYVLLSLGIISISSAFDGPIKTLNNSYQMSKNWHNVSHLTILKSSTFNNESANYQEALKTRSKDFYSWYKNIYQEKGVYLVNSTIYTQNIINEFTDSDTKMPTKKSFLRLTVSPNYLKEIGIKVSASSLAAANQGKRLYLLPASFSRTKTRNFERWLQKDDTHAIKTTDTPTVFNKKRQFLFVPYHSQNSLFTWATKTNEPLKLQQAIILVATPANMTYFESDNLSAQGFGGLVKFDTSKMSSASKKRILASPQISAYNPAFTTIGNFIKGVQKDLSYTLYLFGAVGAVLLALSLTLVYAIIKIYQVSQQELFNVKKFLGYSIFNIYSKPLAFLTIAFVLELLTTIFIRSRAGTLVIIIKFILQTIFILLYLRQSSINQLLNSLKEE